MDGMAHSVHHCAYFFFTSLSLLSLHKLQGGEEREKNKERKRKKNLEDTPKLQ